MTTEFLKRHIGPSESEQQHMLQVIGVSSLDVLIDETVPADIRLGAALQLPDPMTEAEALAHMRELGAQNVVGQCHIGQGYYPCFMPSVIQRNIFENPGWYTQYTPYQAEISQGRLEALMNYQTMVSDLTGLPISNASLLDEGTAAAEAMMMVYRHREKIQPGGSVFVIVGAVLPQTVDVVRTRAVALGLTLRFSAPEEMVWDDTIFGILIAYPDALGGVSLCESLIESAKVHQVGIVAVSDLLALTLLKPPGEWGADICVGSAQRFGVPMGYGGPHAGFIATGDLYIRSMPGRIIGETVDFQGNRAYRMALQTREQHIRREKATSNICTAQALLAMIAGMYAVYHGPEGVSTIAQRTHTLAVTFAQGLQKLGYTLQRASFFDTVAVTVSIEQKKAIESSSESASIYLGYPDATTVLVAFDETSTLADVNRVLTIFSMIQSKPFNGEPLSETCCIPIALMRRSKFCTHAVFRQYRSESQMLRYIKSLEAKDLSLTTSMIPLGSCTMKLNATTQMIPLSWPEWSAVHPFMPIYSVQGYQKLLRDLEAYLCEITGFSACSLQPNSGAQGEYAGLLAIRRFHESQGDQHRNVILIPTSAHGTNPATAALAGFTIILVNCDDQGNIDGVDLTQKAEQHSRQLAGMMMTYPSTHGVFESEVRHSCSVIHAHGGKVYMDGANMNAQVGLTSPALIGADVCHLNLHKTFAIPHGGGGPGMGPICVVSDLAPFLPGHYVGTGLFEPTWAVSSAPWGSASILIISYLYIRMLGAFGVTQATKIAILNANYIKARLEGAYSVLYQGSLGRVAHELILDLRPLKKTSKIEPEDVAKRLMDYGFHAPTMSFPVPGTLMIEPTESEDQAELDRFCEAMLSIRAEIEEIIQGSQDLSDNCLKQSPHTALEVSADQWLHAYGREKAAYPLAYLKRAKFWPPVKRVDNAYGDRNLMCTCS